MTAIEIEAHLKHLQSRIQQAKDRFGRTQDNITLVAVSKTRPKSAVLAAYELGIRHFGENYLQEALTKIPDTVNLNLQWHFIGSIQSNKTNLIAKHFSWVHTVDRITIAQHLNESRSNTELQPLNVCIQVNISDEVQKSGVSLAELPELANAISKLPFLRLRGLMGMSKEDMSFEEQRACFRKLHEALLHLQKTYPELDTLSMGMSDDFEAAIAEGATLLRIGTALFGPKVLRV